MSMDKQEEGSLPKTHTLNILPYMYETIYSYRFLSIRKKHPRVLFLLENRAQKILGIAKNPPLGYNHNVKAI